jgi:hypothetical protein
MTPQMCLDDETKENDVKYGIDDCRKRLRSQRTLRSQPCSPTDVGKDTRIESYAELLTVSMSQGSLSKLVECLLGPGKAETKQPERIAEREKAVIT